MYQPIEQLGGKVPQVATPPRVPKEGATRLQDLVYDAAQAKLVAQTLGLMPADLQPSNNKVQERYNVDFGALMKSQSEILSNTLKQVTDLSIRVQDAQTKAELAEMKAALENMTRALNSQPQNPLQTLADNFQLLEALTEKLRQRQEPQYVPQPGNTTAELQVRLAIAQLEAEREQRKLDHEREMAELRRHWVKEDRIQQQQFQLEQQKFEWEQRIAGKRADQLSSILGALAQGVDLQTLLKGGSQVASQAPEQTRPTAPPEPVQAEAAPQVIPSAFECGTCGQIVTVRSGEDTATCPTCGQMFDISQSTKTPA